MTLYPSGLYMPETIFGDLWPNEHLVFSVTGTELTAAPEPQTVWLTSGSVAVSGLVSRVRHW